MNVSDPILQALYWAPRVLGLLLAGFVSIFALDVFGEGYGVLQTVGALLIHLIPTYLLLAAVGIGWKWEWAGGVLFVALGLAYVLMGRGRFPLSGQLILAGPAILAGLLFLAHWWLSSRVTEVQG